MLATSKANALEQELKDQEGDTQLLYLHRAVPTPTWCARNADGCVDHWWDYAVVAARMRGRLRGDIASSSDNPKQ